MSAPSRLPYILIAALWVVAFRMSSSACAQSLPQYTSSAPAEDAPVDFRRLTPSGRILPPGWNVGAAFSAGTTFDTNPAFAQSATPDLIQRYSGLFTATRFGQYSSYKLSYSPDASLYRKETALNNVSHTLLQEFTQRLGKPETFSWYLRARRSPYWAGSAFSNTAVGTFLMQLNGIDFLSLQQNLTSVENTFGLSTRLTSQSSINIMVGGGVNSLRNKQNGTISALLTMPDSRTWYERTEASYLHAFTARDSITAGAFSDYFLVTVPASRTVETGPQFTYGRAFSSRWSANAGAGFYIRQWIEPHNGDNLGFRYSANVNRTGSRSSFYALVSNAHEAMEQQAGVTDFQAYLQDMHGIGKRWFVGELGSYQETASGYGGGLGTGTTKYFQCAVSSGHHVTRSLVWFINYGINGADGYISSSQLIFRQQVISGLTFNVDRIRLY